MAPVDAYELIDLNQSLERVLESASLHGVELPAAESWPGRARDVLDFSSFVARALQANPLLLKELLDRGDLKTAHASEAEIADRLENSLGEVSDKATLAERLRLARQREMLRIAWRDLSGLANLAETLRDLSAFADAAIRQGLAHLDRWQREARGVPCDQAGNEQHLVVFGLGKLGASELNFSSDVDLIFGYAADGQTRGAKRSTSNHEYFLALGRALIDLLQQRTAEGFVFRVDMRLRPFGRAGALVMSFPAMEDYYQGHGRDWERYALIRLRPVAGDICAGKALLERLEPFVYKRYLDFGTLESLREMKAMIAEEVARRALDDDVKLGPGGIREVEFTTQAFQLVRGGRTPALRDRRLTRVLDEIARLELLPAYAVERLQAAYVFLRRVENRLQEYEDRQTHTLPADLDARARLAQSMGFDSWTLFCAALDTHRAHVREQFDQVLGGDVSDHPVDGSGALLLASQDDAALEAVLAEYGFECPSEARERLLKLRDSHGCRRMDESGERRLKRLLPDLLRAVATTERPMDTLDRVLSVVGNVLRRSTYLALLHERPLVVSHFVRLCAASPWVARQIADQPQLLDELLDARTLYSPPDRAELERDLDERISDTGIGDLELEMGSLRQFKHRQVLRVAAADIAEALPLMRVSDHLTDIAEVILGKALALARRDVSARHGVPRQDDGTEAQFAIVAYGKLGGIELGYGSDLDLVFVYGSCAGVTDGARPVDSQVYFVRLAQRIIHYLTTLTSDGILYEVDTRLRPHGKDGVLACAMESFEEYQRDKAWTWEHQALVRARVVAGVEDLAVAFSQVRQRILLKARDAAKLLEEVRQMRARMRSQLASKGGDSFDLKQDVGGITDIEFMVQYAALRWGARLGSYLAYTDNIRLIEGLERSGLLSKEDAALLNKAYRAYRARVHRLSLQEQPGVLEAEAFEALRSQVSDVWQRLMEDGVS